MNIGRSSSTPDRVTLSQSFLDRFLAAPVPCFALARLQRSDCERGSIAVRLPFRLPANISTLDFYFRHSLFWTGDRSLLCFSLKFRSRRPYHGLVNHRSPAAKVVLETIIETGECPVLLMDSAGTVLTLHFPAASLILSLAKLWQSAGHDPKDCLPLGQVMSWVCNDDLCLLDLNGSCVSLEPRLSGRCGYLR